MKPLENLRVVDATSGPVGGLATMVLADFGAQVIKVEPRARRSGARRWRMRACGCAASAASSATIPSLSS